VRERFGPYANIQSQYDEISFVVWGGPADGRFACQPKLLLLVACYAASYQEGNLEKGKKINHETSTIILYGLLEIWKRNGAIVWSCCYEHSKQFVQA
jgi:hypothetical protein